MREKSNPYSSLDGALGLHQRIEVIYVVDAYEATLTDEREYVIATERGETVAQVLERLNDRIWNRGSHLAD